ncbi:MAG: glycosyltransferase family 39 protein [Planctomycetaceae bacterium]|nr:glycosyltransferase family 39 protein [Planctomycetaceae bacterium]
MTKAWQLVAVAALAGLLLLWNLGGVTLWQDEAATAVLAQRMLKFGKPLAYDGRNLITMDYPPDEESPERLLELSQSPENALRYLSERGDFKADTTWIGHPWGQFVLAAGGFQLFGEGDWQARLPFAVCGVLTVVLLFAFVRARFDALTAWLAVGLLLGNVYWLLHMRQCRYYALTSLLTWLTFVLYWRWQERRRWGGAGFAVSAWLLFQCDYGTFFPVVMLLLGESFWAGRRLRSETLAYAVVLALMVLPWCWYYELGRRLKPTAIPLETRLLGLVYTVNQFVAPLLVLGGALLAAWFERRSRGKHADVSRARLVGVGAAVMGLVTLWMAWVAPFPFHRYVVGLTPFAAWIGAYALASVAGWIEAWLALRRYRAPWAVAGALVLVATPWLALPVNVCLPRTARTTPLEFLARTEFQRLYEIYAGTIPDPTRELLAAVERLAPPDEELLTNGDDIPWMFYTDRRIRGGILAFRVNAPLTGRMVLIARRGAEVAPPWLIQNAVGQLEWTEAAETIVECRRPNCPDPFVNYLQNRESRLVVFGVATPPAAEAE